MSKNNRTPNDDRSDVKNPNNPKYDADQENRNQQTEPAEAGSNSSK